LQVKEPSETRKCLDFARAEYAELEDILSAG
jgi:hypothetical protein